MTSVGEWSPQAIAAQLDRGAWRDLSARGIDDFTGIVPFDLLDREGRANSVSMTVEEGSITSLHETPAAPSALLSYGPPLIGASTRPSTVLRLGDVVRPLPPFDEGRYEGWSFPALGRGGTIVICQELTGTLDGDAAAWFSLRDGVLERIYDRAPEAARQAGVPFVTIRTSWLTRLRWRAGEITTLEMASGTAIQSGSWSGLDFALAIAEQAQAEMCLDPIPLEREIRWLAAALQRAEEGGPPG